MASIKKRPDGVWCARYRDEAGKEHARHFARKTDAQTWLDEVTASVVTGAYVDPKRSAQTFEVWWKAWAGRQVWAAGTLESATTAADSVTFSTVRLRDLRPSHIEAWVKAMNSPTKERKGPLAPSTIATRFNYVSMALRAAVRDRVIARNPAEGVTLPRQRRAAAAMTIPTAAEVGAAQAAAGEHFEAFVAVCAFAGLRLGEAAGLQLGDVDFLRRTIDVRRQIQGSTTSETTVEPPKFSSERTIYVPEARTKLLAVHLERVGTRPVTVDIVNPPATGEEWLFWNPNSDHDDALWNRNSAGQAWRQTRRRARISAAFTLHDLRHFYASGLIADGCDVGPCSARWGTARRRSR